MTSPAGARQWTSLVADEKIVVCMSHPMNARSLLAAGRKSVETMCSDQTAEKDSTRGWSDDVETGKTSNEAPERGGSLGSHEAQN